MAWNDLFGVSEDKLRAYFKIVGLLFSAVLITFVLVFMDWDFKQIAASMRVMFVKMFNVALVWGPGFLHDLSSPGDDIEVMKANPLAIAQFYGLMGIATAVVVAWGAV